MIGAAVSQSTGSKIKMMSSIGAVSQSQTNIGIASGDQDNNSNGEMSLIEKVERTIQQKKMMAQ